MEVSCPACAARYTADDSKLRGKTARMRCRACDTVWLVSGPSSDRASGSPASASDDLDNTAPRAAVQRRGAERERRDLFASRPVEEGGVRETMHPPPASLPPSSMSPGSMSGGGVAARNENSVLFKVTDIFGPAGTARVKTPEPSAAPSPASTYAAPAGARKDDSGIIDLKALSSAPARPNRAPAPMLFGASEPPPAFSRDVSASSSSYPMAMSASPAKSKARTFGMIAAGFAVVALCGVGVALAFGGSNPPPKATAAFTPPPPAPPPAVTAPPAPEPATTSTSKATASNDDSKTSDTPSKKSGKKGKRGGKASSSTSSGLITSKSPPPPPPAKVKPADPCGCHGDFNCILACTAGKK